MAYSAAAIIALASQCAPNVAPQTVLAIVQTESGTRLSYLIDKSTELFAQVKTV